uniref:Galectin n=1 Tax=Panagrellus redivivus TaxID=6233 RepID=A0A7E4W8H1_PANRE
MFYNSYTVSVANDTFDWERIIDHSKYECFGQQVLYFKERAVRFIRIESVDGYLEIDEKIEALFATNPFEIDPVTTLTVPTRNIIPNKMLPKWKSTTGNGFTTGIHFSNGEVIQRKGDVIIYQFSQPYIIGSLKLLFSDIRSYVISVKANDNWTRVFSEKNVSGWRTATFEKQPVVFIQIRDTAPLTNIYNLFKLECPAT